MPSKAKLKSNKAIVAALAAEMKAAKGIVLVDYRGINVEQDTALRSELRKAGVKYSVVKNTMTTFAAKEAGLDGLLPALAGPTAMATSATDSVAPAKILQAYAKKSDKMKIKAGVTEGTVIDVAGVSYLAELPPKEQLIASALGSLMAPVQGMVSVMSANVAAMARALGAVAKKKAAAEGGAAA